MVLTACEQPTRENKDTRREVNMDPSEPASIAIKGWCVQPASAARQRAEYLTADPRIAAAELLHTRAGPPVYCVRAVIRGSTAY